MNLKMIIEIYNRLKGKTPKFFKNIIKISIAVSTLSTLILTSGLVIPDSVLGLITKIGIVAGIVSAFISKLTTLYGTDEDGKVVMYAAEDDTLNPDERKNPPTKG